MLEDVFKEKKDHSVIKRTTMPTNPIITPIAKKTAESKGVLRLKCEAVPRHLCMVTRNTSTNVATPSVPINSQLRTRYFGKKFIIHASDRVVIPKENPNVMALRQETGPSHDPPSTSLNYS